jgi:hypothetical protein
LRHVKSNHQAGKGEKSRILDERLALSGGKSRKYAIFKLNRTGKTPLRPLDGQAVAVTIVEESRKNGSPGPVMTPRICSNCCGKTPTDFYPTALRNIICPFPGQDLDPSG